MEFSNIEFNIGSVNPSGIADTVFFIRKTDIIRWPPITDDFTEALFADGYVQYGDGQDNSFSLAADAVWHRLYSTQGKGKVSWDFLGERDCRQPVNRASMTFPKVTREAMAFAKHASNGDYVFIVKHDGRYYIVGHPLYRTTVSVSGDSGDTAGSGKGLTVSVECCDTTPAPTYIGTLNFEDGVLDCETNQFISYSDMKTNYKVTLTVENNSVVFNALGERGRIHLEGSGDITVEVSENGQNYTEVEHDAAFNNGVAISAITMVIGDYIRISATTLTAAEINFSVVNAAERS